VFVAALVFLLTKQFYAELPLLLSVRRAAVLAFLAILAPLAANAQAPRNHAVKQILLDGNDVASATGVTVTPSNGKAENVIRRGEALADGTRIDVPAKIKIILVSTGSKSATTLGPNSSFTIVQTGKGETSTVNRGEVSFSLLHGALDFFHVRGGQTFTASARGTAFWVDAAGKTSSIKCTSDEVTVSRSGYIQVGFARKPVTLSDVVSAHGRPDASYESGQANLAQFANFKQAEDYYRAQVDATRKRGDSTALLAALNNVTYVQIESGNYMAAGATADEALSLAKVGGGKDEEAHALLSAGRTRAAQGNLAQAVQMYETALSLFAMLGDPDGIARADLDIGNARFQEGDRADALDSYEKALSLFEILGDPDGEARAMLDIGNVYNRQGKLADALESYRKAATFYAEADNRDGQAGVLNNIGNMQRRLGDFSEALKTQQAALSLFQELGDRDGAATALLNIGVVQYSQDKDDAAEQTLRQAATLSHTIGDRDVEAKAIGSIGAVQADQGQYSTALESYQTALTIFRETRDRYSEALALENIGHTQERLTQYAAALQSYEQAAALYQQLGEQGSDAASVAAEIERVKKLLATPATASPNPAPTRTGY
jgi:tetratricopeptide (TPR) repeat protein